MSHNRKVEEAIAAKASRARLLREGLRDHKDSLAQWLKASLRANAQLRLDGLLTKYKVTGHECHDGAAMFTELEGLRNTTGTHDEPLEHDRAVERMRDEQLPDNCSLRDFTDKVNKLKREHLAHMTQPLTGDLLGKFIIRLMPTVNASEGRNLIKEMTKAGTLGNASKVIKECTDIVKETANARGAASAAVPAASAVGNAARQDFMKEVVAATVAAIGGGGGGGKKAAAAAVAAAAAAAADDRRPRRNVSRLEDNKWCSSNSCQYDHKLDPKTGVDICYRHPKTTQAQLEKANPNAAKNPKSVARFNLSKEDNVTKRKLCSREQLVLYKVPPSDAAPAKGAVPMDCFSQCSDAMDGLPGQLSADLFFVTPSAPAVPVELAAVELAGAVDMPDYDAELTIPALSLQEPFASSLINGDKLEESRNTALLEGYAGQLVAIRAGRKAWDNSRGVPSVSGPTSGNGTVTGAVKFGATRPLSVVTAQFGGASQDGGGSHDTPGRHMTLASR